MKSKIAIQTHSTPRSKDEIEEQLSDLQKIITEEERLRQIYPLEDAASRLSYKSIIDQKAELQAELRASEMLELLELLKEMEKKNLPWVGFDIQTSKDDDLSDECKKWVHDISMQIQLEIDRSRCGQALPLPPIKYVKPPDQT